MVKSTFLEDTIAGNNLEINARDLGEMLLGRTRWIVPAVKAAAEADNVIDPDHLYNVMFQVEENLALLASLIDNADFKSAGAS